MALNCVNTKWRNSLIQVELKQFIKTRHWHSTFADLCFSFPQIHQLLSNWITKCFSQTGHLISIENACYWHWQLKKTTNDIENTLTQKKFIIKLALLLRMPTEIKRESIEKWTLPIIWNCQWRKIAILRTSFTELLGNFKLNDTILFEIR